MYGMSDKKEINVLAVTS